MRLDLLREDDEAVGLQPLSVAREPLAARRKDVKLDDVDDTQQWLDRLAELEIVERQPVTGSPKVLDPGIQLLVE